MYRAVSQRGKGGKGICALKDAIASSPEISFVLLCVIWRRRDSVGPTIAKSKSGLCPQAAIGQICHRRVPRVPFAQWTHGPGFVSHFSLLLSYSSILFTILSQLPKFSFHRTEIVSEQSSGAGDRMPSLAPRDPPRMGSGAIFLSSHTILVTGIQQSPQEWGQVSLTILVNWRAVKRRRERQTKPSYRHRMFLKSKLERKEIHIRVVIISPPKKY